MLVKRQSSSMLRFHLTFFLTLVVVPTRIPAQSVANSPANTSNTSDGRVLNAPYSAKRRFTSVEKVADGTTKSSESGGSEARDSLGRTYSAGEASLDLSGSGQTGSEE